MFWVCGEFGGKGSSVGKSDVARIAWGGEGEKGRDVCCDKRQTTANRGEKERRREKQEEEERGREKKSKRKSRNAEGRRLR